MERHDGRPMPFSALSTLGRETPVRVLVIHAASELSVTLAGLVQPLRLAAQALGAERLQVDVAALGAAADPDARRYHLTLLVADDHGLPADIDGSRALVERCQQSDAWGAVGTAVLWLARLGEMRGLRTALPWDLYADVNEAAEHAILTPNLFECDGMRLSCCGGTASIDFSLTLIEAWFGAPLQAQIREAMCVDRVRGAGERQRQALQARFGELQPKLSEAVTLMENNIEEPLSTDEVANLVGISRRQLERQFKQYLGSVPSRYYLELRLQRARQLLLDSHHSIVQVGLMCGFSSSSHFATAYGSLFGMTPRDERQRKLLPESR